jgi:serine protease Do
MRALGDRATEDLASVAEGLRRVTVVIEPGPVDHRRGWSGRGSGIIWSSDGTIVTNAHVATAPHAAVTFADGRRARARVVARDPRRDLALLRLDVGALAGPLPAPRIGAPRSLRPGELVVALGHPLGIEHALALGVVHIAPDARRSPYVVADIRLAPGNSGGPLADTDGRIIGVNSMIVGGLGVAISTDVVRRLVERVASTPERDSAFGRDAA